jgi:excisionase family DNA binding protein
MTEYIKPGEAAELLGVSRDSIRRYADAGHIDAITTPGGQRRIDRHSVETYTGKRTRISSTVTVIEPAC